MPIFYILQRVNIDQIILEEIEDNEAQVQTDDTYNQVQRYKAKGTDKRNADINVCGGIGFIQHFGKSEFRSDNLEEVEGRADKMLSNARQSTISRCKYNNTTTVRYYLSLKWMYVALLSSKYIQLINN